CRPWCCPRRPRLPRPSRRRAPPYPLARGCTWAWALERGCWGPPSPPCSSSRAWGRPLQTRPPSRPRRVPRRRPSRALSLPPRPPHAPPAETAPPPEAPAPPAENAEPPAPLESEPSHAHASTSYPVAAIRLDARKDIIPPASEAVELMLDPSGTYRLSEPEP